MQAADLPYCLRGLICMLWNSGRHCHYVPESCGRRNTLSLIARFNKGEGPDSLIMNITLTSPDNIRGSETVTFPSGYYIIKRYVKDHPEDRRIMLASTPDYYDICWEYRSGIIPPVPGDWEIAITLPDSPEGLRGIGITIKSEQHGKRQDT